MLFDKVLLQTLSTDVWRATTTTYADYSAEVIFLFLAFGIFNNRLDTDTWQFMIIITSSEETDVMLCSLKLLDQNAVSASIPCSNAPSGSANIYSLN